MDENKKLVIASKLETFPESSDLKTGSAQETSDLKTGSSQETSDLKTVSFSGPPDLIINFKEKKFAVHKSVLIRKCRYFRIMLTKFKEAYSSEIDIEFYVNVEMFKSIINYIYTDEIVFSTSNVEEISTTAIYFMLDNLVQSSFDFKVNYFELILKNESFLKWELSSVQEVLQSDRVVVSNEKKMLTFATKWIQNDFDQRREHATEVLQNVRFVRLTKKEKAEVGRQFEISKNLSTTSTAPRQYQTKGIYLHCDYGDRFQRYCPIDDSVTNLTPPPRPRLPKLVVHNEQVYRFGRSIEDSNFVHIYNPITDTWSKESIANDAIIKFQRDKDGYCYVKYCSFEGVIYAFVVCYIRGNIKSEMKAFRLRSNIWMANTSTLSISRSALSFATACGDSIYFFVINTRKLYRYKPSTDELNTISYPYLACCWKILAYKAKLLFCGMEQIVVFDTTTNSFNKLFYPFPIYKPHTTVYNDTIYFLIWDESCYDDESGLSTYKVYQLDPKLLDGATKTLVLSSVDLKTEIGFIHPVVSIQ